MSLLHRFFLRSVVPLLLVTVVLPARADDDDREDESDRDAPRYRYDVEERDDRAPRRSEVPPEWTRDRRGRPKKVLRAEEGALPPPGYRESTRPMRALVIPGAILLPVAWLTSSVTSLTCIIADAVPNERGCGVGQPGWGFAPLMGPFVTATANGTDPGWRAGYALYGAFQNAGLAMVIIGASIQEDIWVLTPEAQRAEAERASIFVGPGSIGVRGAF